MLGSDPIVQSLCSLTFSVFAVAVVVTVGSALSRPGSRSFEGQSYREIVRFNPPAAFFVAYGRLFPSFLRAVAVCGALLGIAVLARAIAA